MPNQFSAEAIHARITTGIKRALQVDGAEWQRAVQDRGQLKARTGTLKRSIRYQVTGDDLGTLELRGVSAGTPYARTQQFGAVIRAKNVKNLTIPLSDAKTAGGDVKAQFASARTFIGAHKKEIRWIKAKNGGVLVAWQPPKGKLLFLWKLQPTATIPGPSTTGIESRLGFFEAWRMLQVARDRRHAEVIRRAVSG